MKRWMITRIAAVCLAAFATACGDGDTGVPAPSGGPLTKVTFMLDYTPNTNHSGIYLAKEKGWYRDAGIEIDIIQPAATGIEQAVAAGRAQFAVSFQENVIPARAQGVPVVSVAAVIQHNTSSLLSLAADNIKRPRDLEGKTYGGYGGPLETALVKKLVSCDGGNPEKVKFVELGEVDYLVGMEQGRFDFAWIFDGWDGVRITEITKQDVNVLRFIDYAACIPDWYTPIIITSEKVLKEDGDLARRFMAATARGYEYAIDHPSEAADALLKNAPETDATLARASAAYLASRYADKGSKWGRQDERTWVRFENFLREAKLTDKPVDVSQAFTNDLLP